MKICKTVLLVLFVFLLSCCGKTISSDEIDYYEKEGIFVIKNKENKPFTGTIQVCDNGILIQEFDIKNGKKQGEEISYYEDGIIESKINYVNGKIQGEASSYNEDGRIQVKANYVDEKTR